jgi:quercetin dioxygenase-like cupin family protein
MMELMRMSLAARGALCAMVMALTAGGGPARADVVEDITASAPRIAKVAFENEYVRGIEFTLRPGQTLPIHEGQPRVVYSLADYQILWTEGDAAPVERTWKKGDVHWHDAVPHAVENLGTTVAKYLVVTRRNTPLPSSEPYRLTDDAASVDPRHATVVFENEHVRITDVRIPVGERQPVHDGGYRLIYSLSAYTIKYESDQHGTRATRWKPGMAHWHEPDAHAVENAGNHFVHFVIFAFKR